MLGLWTRFFFINPKQSQACNFSLCCYYLIKQKILQNNEKDHNGWNSLMIEQILPTYTTRQNWSSLRRIFILLPRLKKVIVVCELCPFWSSQKYGEQEGIFLGTSRGNQPRLQGLLDTQRGDRSAVLNLEKTLRARLKGTMLVAFSMQKQTEKLRK